MDTCPSQFTRKSCSTLSTKYCQDCLRAEGLSYSSRLLESFPQSLRRDGFCARFVNVTRLRSRAREWVPIAPTFLAFCVPTKVANEVYRPNAVRPRRGRNHLPDCTHIRSGCHLETGYTSNRSNIGL